MKLKILLGAFGAFLSLCICPAQLIAENLMSGEFEALSAFMLVAEPACSAPAADNSCAETEECTAANGNCRAIITGYTEKIFDNEGNVIGLKPKFKNECKCYPNPDEG